MNNEHRKLIRDLSKELAEGNMAIFAGAGLSRSAGFVDWKGLLKPFAEDLDLDIERESDLVTLAQYHTNNSGANRSKLTQALVTEFSTGENVSLTENHKILARLPIQTYWTTNYDKLIENALEQSGKVPDVKYTIKQLAVTRPKRDAVVYKMHGDVDHAAEAVLIRDDYERYHVSMQPYINALSGDLISKAFLFLGFSFTDPNLDYILSRVRIQYAKDQRQHYCILRRASKMPGENPADFEYRKRKEDLFREELRRFGINVVYVAQFSEITDILREIERRHKSKTLFISGAAHDYGEWGREKAENFVYKLSRSVSASQYRVISGFGLGIGSAVISGVLEETIMKGRRLDSDQLILRPFPQSQQEDQDREKLWTEYRRNMIAHAGIAIFVFGNKLSDGKVVLSNGMVEEFTIALEDGLFVIPVGITGYTAAQLWEQVISTFDKSRFKHGDELLSLLRKLGPDGTDLETAHKTIMEILLLVQG